MAKIMVTGGAGMIGSNLVKRLIFAGHDVIVVDNLWRGKLKYLTEENGEPMIDIGRSFFKLDLRNIGAIDHLLDGIDYVYHLADIVAGIGYVFNNEGSLFRDNFLINSNVVNSVRSSKIKGYVYVGTACSFPAHMQTGIEAPPLSEKDQYPAAPESAYGWSKLMGEYEALLMEKETGIPVCVLILHNVYGSPCDFGETKSQVIPSLIRKAIKFPKEDFIVWGSGNQGRAFVHVEDVVNALEAAMKYGFGHGTIQIGPDYCHSIREIAEILVDISGKKIPIKFDTTKPEGDKGRCADYGKAKRLLGWEPRIDLKKGLTQLYEWVQKEATL